MQLSFMLIFAVLGTSRSVYCVANLTVADALYKYLFQRPHGASLSIFPYCYDAADDTTHKLYENGCLSQDGAYVSCHGSNENHTWYHSALDVFVEVSINQLLEVNERLRSMRLKLTVYQMWTDCRLQWSTADFPISELHISIEQFRMLGIYVPTLLLHEEVTPEASRSSEKWISISSNGLVYLERMYTTELSCAFDISMYPFDTQACNLTFESMLEKPIVSLVNAESPNIIPADRIRQFLSMYHLGVGRFIPSDTWELIVLAGSYGTRNICAIFNIAIDFEKCLYDFVTHNIILRRHPAYQLLNLLLPAFLIVTISSCVFLLPPGTGDKTNLSITILLSLFIFMQVMYYKMPETGETLPLLTQYYICCVGLIVISCIAGTISTILNSAALPIPTRLRSFVHRYGSRLLRDRISIDLGRINMLDPSIQPTGADCAGESFNPLLHHSSARRFKHSCQWDCDWHHIAIIFDRTIFIIHILSGIAVLTGYLVWGYISHSNYGFLLNEEGWKFRNIQMEIANDHT